MGEIFHSRPWITAEDEAAVRAALASGWLAQGDLTTRFEEEMSRWIGAAGAVAAGSGGAALQLALHTLECGPGSEVILPTYVCRTVLDAVVTGGARPVLCDVGPDWVVRSEEITPHLTPLTRAIIVPHMYGVYADVAAIRRLGVPVIEDAAQALGPATMPAVRGDVIVLSFHPTKCLTTGEGGMVLALDARLVEKCRRGRDVADGTLKRQFAPLSDIAAALGRSQLTRYTDFLGRRQAMAQRYHESLRPLAGIDLEWLNRVESMFFRFPLRRSGGVARCQAEFLRHGVHVRRGVDQLLHRLLGLPDEQFPSAVTHFQQTISLPIYPTLDSAQLGACIRAAVSVLSQND